MVCFPVFSHIDADMGEHHLEIGVVYIVKPLSVIHFIQAEHAKVRPEGLDAAGGKRAA